MKKQKVATRILYSRYDESGADSLQIFPLGMTVMKDRTRFKNGSIKMDFSIRKTYWDHVPLFIAVEGHTSAGAILQEFLRVKDSVIATRLVSYIDLYHGKKDTNCSTLAEFLFSGNFMPCVESRYGMMFQKALRPYRGQRIGVGDVLFSFLHKNNRSPKSRRVDPRLREQYRLARNAKDVLFENVHVQGVFGVERILKLWEFGCFQTFHFITCIAESRGRNVFASQIGLNLPGKGPEFKAPVVFTFDPIIPGDIPFLTLIRKR